MSKLDACLVAVVAEASRQANVSAEVLSVLRLDLPDIIRELAEVQVEGTEFFGSVEVQRWRFSEGNQVFNVSHDDLFPMTIFSLDLRKVALEVVAMQVRLGLKKIDAFVGVGEKSDCDCLRIERFSGVFGRLEIRRASKSIGSGSQLYSLAHSAKDSSAVAQGVEAVPYAGTGVRTKLLSEDAVIHIVQSWLQSSVAV